jgi:PD-(D/E)XK nuclease superfamily
MFLEDQTYAVIGAAIEVLNELGHGIHEKPYENALLVGLFSLDKSFSGHLSAASSPGYSPVELLQPRGMPRQNHPRKSASIRGSCFSLAAQGFRGG